MKTVLVVFGTRPEAIKMAPLIIELKKHSEKFKVDVCVTGQHRQMLDQVLDLFQIQPDYDLNLMKSGQDLIDVMSGVLLGMKEVLINSKPDIVLVHGDTITSMAASLSAFFLKIPVGHVEAGLRTYNKRSPWPEELNRQLTGRISNYHFCPTQNSKQNLISEGVDEQSIFITGNTVIDALFYVLRRIEVNEDLKDRIKNSIINSGISLFNLGAWENGQRKLILITGHRRENFGQGFIDICHSIKSLAFKYSNVDFLFPVHLNPNVRKAVYEVFQNKKFNNIFLIEPIEYYSFVYLMNLSYLILTDSGGIQEEAPSLGKPVLVMRDTTERPEAVLAGSVKLIGTKESSIVEEVSNLIDSSFHYNSMSNKENPYGDGRACSKIINAISDFILIY